MTDYRTVPVEPTPEMWRAMEREFDRDPDLHHETVISNMWEAALIASPAPAPGEDQVETALRDPATVHINMLRGGIAKPTPAQIGHLHRGDEAAEVIREVARQNPDAARAVIAAMQPVSGEPMRRIDLDEEGELDDLAIDGSLVKMVRLERMAGNSFWMRLYMHDGDDFVLWLTTAKSLIRARIEEGQPLPSPPGVGG